MKTYGQFCPVAMALDVIGERWSLLIVREMIAGSRRFNEILNGVPKMPRSMLARRLKQLEDAGILSRHGTGQATEYELTEAGRALEEAVMAMGVWGRKYASGDLREHHLDPRLLMWDMQRRIAVDALPKERTLVRFDFSDADHDYRSVWLKLDRGEADVCLTHPGFSEDLVIETKVQTLTEIWMGDRTIAESIDGGSVRVTGSRQAMQAWPRWFELNVFANVKSAPATRAKAGAL